MAETRLTEHVWMNGPSLYYRYDSGEVLHSCNMGDELAQALLAERQRLEKLRAALEECERCYLFPNRVKATAQQALREDGEDTQNG